MTWTARAAIIACGLISACNADGDAVSLLQAHVVIDEDDDARLDKSLTSKNYGPPYSPPYGPPYGPPYSPPPTPYPTPYPTVDTTVAKKSSGSLDTTSAKKSNSISGHDGREKNSQLRLIGYDECQKSNWLRIGCLHRLHEKKKKKLGLIGYDER